MNKKSNSQFAKEVINKEISALKRTVRLIDNNFGDACNIIINNKGKVITLGLGKSSFIAIRSS